MRGPTAATDADVRYTAIVMAAQRPGEHPLAGAADNGHKCLIDLHGQPMIAWVLDTLLNAPMVDKVLISIENSTILNHVPSIASTRLENRVEIVESGENLYASVNNALARRGAAFFPALITTADNPLLTVDMLTHFCAELESRHTEAALAMTRATVLRSKYPDGQQRFYAFGDGEYANCNLYALAHEHTLAAAKIFKGGGQFRKKAYRMLRAFGPINVIRYQLGTLTRKDFEDRLSKSLGLRFTCVEMPYAEAPIDVDNERTLRIARSILAGRTRRDREAS